MIINISKRQCRRRFVARRFVTIFCANRKDYVRFRLLRFQEQEVHKCDVYIDVRMYACGCVHLVGVLYRSTWQGIKGVRWVAILSGSSRAFYRPPLSPLPLAISHSLFVAGSTSRHGNNMAHYYRIGLDAGDSTPCRARGYPEIANLCAFGSWGRDIFQIYNWTIYIIGILFIRCY